MYRTKTCGELNIKNVNETVELAGWIQKIRDLGAMIFIDLRDQFGITQIVINNEELQKQAKELTTESCIHISGKVVERSNKNTKIPTGEIEVIANEIEILGKCKNVLPFEINTDQEVREDLRLEYRFLDLRNEKLHNNILLRSKILKTLRDRMDELGFAEIQTPILANSSPEGARDYLVPSRLNPGEFYALPQAPQQFKQLLMVSGFDKYYIDHTLAIWPQAASGEPFSASQFQSTGDTITDLYEDMAAEQKARLTYDNILRLVKDPEIADPIRFLREREIVHFQRFGEALRKVQDERDSRNFYAFNPQIDKKSC